LFFQFCKSGRRGALAQLASAPAWHAGGQGFESLMLHHIKEDIMDTLHIRPETPREIGSLIYDMGKGAVKLFMRHMREPVSMPGTAYEEPLDTADWGSTYMNDNEIAGLVAAMHEVQRHDKNLSAA
jgi:hypothetical protein